MYFWHFWVFVFGHRAYSKTRKPRKIFTSSFFKVLSLFIWYFEHSSRHFVLLKQNLQSIAQSYQWAFTTIPLKWLFWLLKRKSCLGKWLFSSFLVIAIVDNGCFQFRKLSVDFRHFRVFVFCHRAYSKTRKPRKIFIGSFFEVLRLFIWFWALI